MGRTEDRIKTATRSTLDLQQSVLNYLRSGEPGPVFLGGGNEFPQGLTYDRLGLPEDFNLVPGSNRNLEQAFAGAEGLVGSPLDVQRRDALGTLLGGEASFNPDPALRERFFKTAVEDPTLRTFNRDMLPAIAHRFGGTGQMGAARGATSQGITDTLTNLAGARSGFLREDERLAAASKDTALGRALGAVPQSLLAQTTPISVGTQIGGIQRAMGGQQNAEQLIRALLAQPFSDPNLALLGAMGGNVPLAQFGSQGIQGLGSLVSGVSSAGAAGADLFNF